MGSLDGKVAIVTGAGRGIGRGHAMLLAAEGAAVIVNDIGAALSGEGHDDTPAKGVVDEIVTAGGRAAANSDDVSTWQGAERLVAQAVDTFGQLNVLVNNAGILRDQMSFNMDESSWDASIQVNLKGHLAPTRFAGAYWREQSKAGNVVTGRVINTTSEIGLFGGPGQVNYGAAKGAIAAMTLILARELERYGVTVNAVAPRARTRLTEHIIEAAAEGTFDAFDPDNVAPTVAWLASDAAADVNGQVFIAGGGDLFRVEGWHVTGVIRQDHRWTPAEIEARRAELFGDRPTHMGPFAFPD